MKKIIAPALTLFALNAFTSTLAANMKLPLMDEEVFFHSPSLYGDKVESIVLLKNGIYYSATYKLRKFNLKTQKMEESQEVLAADLLCSISYRDHAQLGQYISSIDCDNGDDSLTISWNNYNSSGSLYRGFWSTPVSSKHTEQLVLNENERNY